MTGRWPSRNLNLEFSDSQTFPFPWNHSSGHTAPTFASSGRLLGSMEAGSCLTSPDCHLPPPRPSGHWLLFPFLSRSSSSWDAAAVSGLPPDPRKWAAGKNTEEAGSSGSGTGAGDASWGWRAIFLVYRMRMSPACSASQTSCHKQMRVY